MKPSLKYWIFILGIAGVIFGVILASVVGSWLNLTPAEQQVIEGLGEKILPYPLMGAIILAGIICSLVTLLFRFYIIPILKMAETTQLIALANPDYRITPEGGKEVVRLAQVINAAAEESQKLRSEVDEAIRTARAELREERNRFAALMSELPLGVLACNTDGQILLYNQQAQALLHLPTQATFAYAPPGADFPGAKPAATGSGPGRNRSNHRIHDDSGRQAEPATYAGTGLRLSLSTT
jgi:DNA polymerase III subunit epsilon